MKKDALPAKLYLAEAAAELAIICRQIEENDDAELPQSLIDSFGTTSEQLAAGVDRRVAVAQQFKATIDMAKNQARQMRDFAVKLEKAYEVFKDRTKQIVEANPDVQFKDSLGRKLTVAKNGRPKLKLTIDSVRGKKALSNIVDEGAIELLGIDNEYLETVSFTILKTDKVVADLAAGKSLPWAELETKTHLRGL